MSTAFIEETKIDKLNISKIIRIHLLVKLIEYGIEEEFSDKEIKILSELYIFGGTENKEDIEKFCALCFEKQLSKSLAFNSIRNVFTKSRKLGVVSRKQSNKWVINKQYGTPLDSSNVLFKYLITNIDAKIS